MLQLTADRPLRRAGQDPAAGVLRFYGLGLTLETCDGMERLAPLWDEFGAAAPPSVFQSYKWLETWCRTAAPAQREQPLVAVIRSADGRPRLLLPLGLKRVLGVTVAELLAQSHANYGVPLMERSFQESITLPDLWTILRALGRERAIAAYHFDKQPAVWNGLPNPFAAWSARACVNDSYVLPINPDFDALNERLFSKRTRSMLRRKARKLTAGGEVTIGSVTAESERQRLLDAFFAYKGDQLAGQGADNVFASPGVADFYVRLLDLPQSAGGRLDVRALSVGGAAVAIALVATFAERHYLLNMALAPEAPRDCSPGAVLLNHDIEQACRDGSTAYDFGPGAAAYKAAWQPETLALTTSIAAVSPAGLPAAAMLASASLARRTIKRSPTLWPLAQRLRQGLRGRSNAGFGSAD